MKFVEKLNKIIIVLVKSLISMQCTSILKTLFSILKIVFSSIGSVRQATPSAEEREEALPTVEGQAKALAEG